MYNFLDSPKDIDVIFLKSNLYQVLFSIIPRLLMSADWGTARMIWGRKKWEYEKILYSAQFLNHGKWERSKNYEM